MVLPAATAAANLGGKVRIAVLQPFLKHAAVVNRQGRGRHKAGQDGPRASASYADALSKLDEAVALADTLGCEVVLKQVVPLRSVHPKFLFGSGKAAEMSGVVSAANADTVFVNAPLSGAQQKGLAEKWEGATILDRFRVILDIFADRARTTEAKLQVELARLKYEAAHLVQSGGANKGRDSGYDRQRGGLGAVGGSGEKALETQRRLLRDRTAEVNRQLKDVERRRGFQRGARNRRLEPTVALVGYTNVGKSSLLNQLTLSHHRAGGVGGQGVEAAGGGGGGGFSAGGSGWGGGRGKGMVHARNRVFDTLDPTVRSMTLPSRARCVLVDTVGFIQDLPTDLVHSFRATLEEVRRADILLHVRDASVEARVYESQRAAVEETLAELGALDVPTLEVWNKVDKEVVAVGSDANISCSSSSSSGGELAADRAQEPGLSSNVEDGGGARGGGRRRRGNAGGDMSYPDDDEEARRGQEAVDVVTDGRDSSICGTKGDNANDDQRTRSQGTLPRDAEAGPSGKNAIRVSAATGEGLGLLLEKVDALLHLGGGSRFGSKPLDLYRYVRVLPGQSQQ